MATAASPSSSNSSRPTYSCIRYANRKVKCDRERPCSACVKRKVDCVFNPTLQPGKIHRRVKDQTLNDRIRHYEKLLQQQGIDPSRPPDTPDSKPLCSSSHTATVAADEAHLQTPFSIDSEPSRSINKTQVVHCQGRSKFVDNYLWTRVVEEFHDPKDALEDSSDDADGSQASDDDFNFVLNSLPKPTTRHRHPPPDRIHQLWQIFIENVDPLTKVLHVPTLRPAVGKAADNTEHVPRSFEALLFAIYSTAVMSLSDDECRQRLCESRKTLLSRYASATKAALSRAKFMGTTSLVVLQALVLHLLSVRDIYEPRAVWSLTGAAIRIAQSMGLERDGASLGLPPFEAEMRRRLWWLLKTHDIRAAELCGLPKLQDLNVGAHSTKGPTNVNDDQLHPSMPLLVAESNTLTDVVFIAMIYELVKLGAGFAAMLRQQGTDFGQQDLHASGENRKEIDKAFRGVEDILETKYLRYCDPSQPLHLMTMLMARSSMNVVRFLSHHPRRWASIEQTPLLERQWVWEISIKLLEQHNMMQSNPKLKQFAWHAAYFLQWHAFIHILDTLRANPLISDAEKAWNLVTNTYENNPNMVSDTKKPIHIAVGNLCLKAYSAREAAFQNSRVSPPLAPEFILQLRKQREVAKSKRQARAKKCTKTRNTVCQPGCSRLDTDVSCSSETSKSAHLQQSTIPHSPSLTSNCGATDSDPFWFLNGFIDDQVDESSDVMNMDIDLMLAQDQKGVDNTTQTIDWEQWDAWLADSSVVRLLSSARS